MQEEWTFIQKIKLLAGSFVIVLAVFLIFKYCFVYLWPFATGAAIALAIEKPVNYLTKKMPKGKLVIASLVVFIIAAALLGIVLYVIFLGVGELGALIKRFGVSEEMYEFTDICCDVDDWMGLKRGESISFLCTCKKRLISVFGNVVLKNSIGTIKAVIISLGSIFVSFIAAVYIYAKLDNYRAWRRKSIFSKEILRVHRDLKVLINVYFRIQFIIFVINSALCIGVFMLLKNPYAFVLGISIGFLDALPIFGTGTVLVPWVLVLVLMKKFKTALILTILYVVTYLVRQIMESKCIGEGVGIEPLTMLAVIFVGLLTYGIMGFILGPVSYVIMKSLVICLKDNIKLLEKGQGT